MMQGWYFIIAELRRPEGPPSGAPYPYRKQKKTHELIFSRFLASGIARGRVRTTTVESRKMAAILQMIGRQRHAALIYRVLLRIYDNMPWSNDTCQIKLSADQYHVTISRAQVYSSLRSRVLLKLTADQVLVFDWIAGSCLVNLLKTDECCAA